MGFATQFLSTPSARRATSPQSGTRRSRGFLSTPSARRATFKSRQSLIDYQDFYPRPPRGGRQYGWKHLPQPILISIHALREEGDRRSCRLPTRKRQFLSTPSARRATANQRRVILTYEISIHALREEGDQLTGAGSAPPEDFYPRPPRGGRLQRGWSRATPRYFYPRPPRGGRHHRVCAGQLVVQISIHALREEDDTVCLIVLGIAFDFYPRPPRGGRRLYTCEVIGEPKFLSTPSARRATDNSASFLPGEGFLSTPSARRATFTKASSILTELISIHALREEGDLPQNCQAEQRRYFYPRPPRGGRPAA